MESASKRLKIAEWVKEKLEKSPVFKIAIFLVTILGTSMVIGDGVLTPCISVISAVDGVKEKAPSLSDTNISWISAAILIALFSIQRFGTDKVGYSFAPMVATWFLLIGGIGVYNLFKYDITVLRAFNPKYIVDYFKRNGKQGWISLGGIVLCITGTEAMFADLGHFNVRAIQIGFSCALLPGVSLAYIGQAAYLSKFPDNVSDAFYKSIPGPLFWPTFIVAISTAIIASQAMISGAFAIIWQSQNLGCFPRVRVYHTSAKYEGQVYIPEVNYALMIACVIVAIAFKKTAKIGNAYGIAVVFVMVITTCMVTIIMLVIWKTKIWWILLFLVVFGGAELLYLSSVLYKFTEGGYLPLAFSLVMMMIMGVWHYVHVKRYWFELNNKVPSNYIKDLAQNQDIRRIPGVGFFYSELVQGIPPIFPHFIEKIPSIHSVLVFVSIKHLPISRVELQERFIFRQVKPKDTKIFRCVARYGYNDALEGPSEFEGLLVEKLKRYIHNEYFGLEKGDAMEGDTIHGEESMSGSARASSGYSTVHIEETLSTPQDVSQGLIQPANYSDQLSSSLDRFNIEEEMQFIQKEMEKGVVYLLGEAEVVADKKSSFFKIMTVNYLYNFLRKNFTHGEKSLMIPRDKVLKVGMTYEI
ncbi:potassium transporter 5 [Canna indica]|uniref:Potassium transporter n=1 Tax=Canna indica TaxID=4628 RepID=A0AAQ3Q9V8_9LILI|nr:potassium transporter 5 [Canna indica]